MKQASRKKTSTDITIQKTLLTCVLQQGFWDRWFAHGVEPKVIKQNKSRLATLDGWISVLSNRALELSNLGSVYQREKELEKAEYSYRLAGLYYCLLQWVFPEQSDEKSNWYSLCLSQFTRADELSKDHISKQFIEVEGKEYLGRLRVPSNPSGVVIIITPIDSPKEELFTYEADFTKAGYAVLAFDGPGQGETIEKGRVKASVPNQSAFLEGVTEFAANKFSGLPIYLFGTSSGATWAIERSKDPRISKVVAVSPPTRHEIHMPDFFRERMENTLEDFEKGFLPRLEDLDECTNILMFHGGQDVMVEKNDIVSLYDELSEPKRLIEYEKEGHCCNFRLAEIRQRAINWMRGGDLSEI